MAAAETLAKPVEFIHAPEVLEPRQLMSWLTGSVVVLTALNVVALALFLTSLVSAQIKEVLAEFMSILRSLKSWRSPRSTKTVSEARETHSTPEPLPEVISTPKETPPESTTFTEEMQTPVIEILRPPSLDVSPTSEAPPSLSNLSVPTADDIASIVNSNSGAPPPEPEIPTGVTLDFDALPPDDVTEVLPLPTPSSEAEADANDTSSTIEIPLSASLPAASENPPERSPSTPAEMPPAPLLNLHLEKTEELPIFDSSMIDDVLAATDQQQKKGASE